MLFGRLHSPHLLRLQGWTNAELNSQLSFGQEDGLEPCKVPSHLIYSVY